MKTQTVTGAAPVRRSVAAKALQQRCFARRIVRARKGRGSYSRKDRPLPGAKL
jgi:stalled ribosome alternative rescue factor ArfA